MVMAPLPTAHDADTDVPATPSPPHIHATSVSDAPTSDTPTDAPPAFDTLFPAGSVSAPSTTPSPTPSTAPLLPCPNPGPPAAPTLPSSSHPPEAGPDATDSAVRAAVAATVPPPIPPERRDLGPVPAYDEGGLTGIRSGWSDERLWALGFPLTRMPEGDDTLAFEKRLVVSRFLTSAVEDAREMVAHMVDRGLVSPDIGGWNGETALGAAARQGHLAMAKLLVHLGATPDLAFKYGFARPGFTPPTRTPLLLAAENGHLAMVKYLLSLGADEGFVASDGQIALRLAAKNKHKEVVDLLPARRDGAMLRWKTAHAQAIYRIKRILHSLFDVAKFFVWYVPKFFLWDVPVQIGKAVGKATKWAYEHRAAFPGWCKRRAVAIGKGAKRAAHEVADGTKRAAKAIPGIVKAAPGAIRDAVVGLAKWTAGLATAIGLWAAQSARAIAAALGALGARVLSLLHTILSAIGALIARVRSVTLKDIAAGLATVGRALAGVPHTLWSVTVALVAATYKALGATLQFFVIVVYFLAWIIVMLVTYLPRMLIEIVLRLCQSVGTGLHELLVWFDPKRT